MTLKELDRGKTVRKIVKWITYKFSLFSVKAENKAQNSRS